MSSVLSPSAYNKILADLSEDAFSDKGLLLSCLSVCAVSEDSDVEDHLLAESLAASSSLTSSVVDDYHRFTKAAQPDLATALDFLQQFDETLHAEQEKSQTLQARLEVLQDDSLHALLDDLRSSNRQLQDAKRELETSNRALDDRVKALNFENLTFMVAALDHEGSIRKKDNEVWRYKKEAEDQRYKAVLAQEAVEQMTLQLDNISKQLVAANSYIRACIDINLDTTVFQDTWRNAVEAGLDLTKALTGSIASAARKRDSIWREVMRSLKEIERLHSLSERKSLDIPHGQSDEEKEVDNIMENVHRGIYPALPSKSVRRNAQAVSYALDDFEYVFDASPKLDETYPVAQPPILQPAHLDEHKDEFNCAAPFPSARPNSTESVESASSYGSTNRAIPSSSTPLKKGKVQSAAKKVADTSSTSIALGRTTAKATIRTSRTQSPAPSRPTSVSRVISAPAKKKVASTEPARPTSLSSSSSTGSRLSSPTYTSLGRTVAARNSGTSKPAWGAPSPPSSPTRSKAAVANTTSPVKRPALRAMDLNTNKATSGRPSSSEYGKGKENVGKEVKARDSENQRKRRGVIMEAELDMDVVCESQPEVKDDVIRDKSYLEGAVAATAAPLILEDVAPSGEVARDLEMSASVEETAEAAEVLVQIQVLPTSKPESSEAFDRFVVANCLQAIFEEDEASVDDPEKRPRTSTESRVTEDQQIIKERAGSYDDELHPARYRNVVTQDEDVIKDGQDFTNIDYLSPPPKRHHRNRNGNQYLKPTSSTSSTAQDLCEPKPSPNPLSSPIPHFPIPPNPPLRISFADNHRELELTAEKIEQNALDCVHMLGSMERLIDIFGSESSEFDDFEDVLCDDEALNVSTPWGLSPLDVFKRDIEQEMAETEREEDESLENERQENEKIESDWVVKKSTVEEGVEEIEREENTPIACIKNGLKSFSGSSISKPLIKSVTWGTTTINTCEALSSSSSSSLNSSEETQSSSATGSGSGSGTHVSCLLASTASIEYPTVESPTTAPTAKTSKLSGFTRRFSRASVRQSWMDTQKHIPQPVSTSSLTPTMFAPSADEPTRKTIQAASQSIKAPQTSHERRLSSSGIARPLALQARRTSLIKPPNVLEKEQTLPEPKLSIGRNLLRRLSNIPGSGFKNKSTPATAPSPTPTPATALPPTYGTSMRRSPYYLFPQPSQSLATPVADLADLPISPLPPSFCTPSPQDLAAARRLYMVAEEDEAPTTSRVHVQANEQVPKPRSIPIVNAHRPAVRSPLSKSVHTRTISKGSQDLKYGSGVKQATALPLAHQRNSSRSGAPAGGLANGRSGIPGLRTPAQTLLPTAKYDTSKSTAPSRMPIKKSSLPKPQAVRNPSLTGALSTQPSHTRQGSAGGIPRPAVGMNKGKRTEQIASRRMNIF